MNSSYKANFSLKKFSSIAVDVVSHDVVYGKLIPLLLMFLKKICIKKPNTMGWLNVQVVSVG